jgi:hypothetical protein
MVGFIEEDAAIALTEIRDEIQRERQVRTASDTVVRNHKRIGENDDPPFTVLEIGKYRAIAISEV